MCPGRSVWSASDCTPRPALPAAGRGVAQSHVFPSTELSLAKTGSVNICDSFPVALAVEPTEKSSRPFPDAIWKKDAMLLFFS